MRILGLNLSHDASACLAEDGEIRVALSLERLVRTRRGIIPSRQIPRAMAELIDYCLTACDCRIEDIDYFVGTTTESASPEEESMILRDIGYFPREKILSLPHPSHHLAHACAAFYGSGFDSAAALVIDAYGSRVGNGRECESSFWFEDGRQPRLISRAERPAPRVAGTLRNGRFEVPRALFGIGEIYRLVTLILGFMQRGTYYDDPGKTMGLAPFGRRLSNAPQMIRVVDGELSFDGAYEFLRSLNLISEQDDTAFLNVRADAAPLSAFHRDLACQVQWEFEEACLHLVRRLIATTKTGTLVLGGGSFLNSVVNHRILCEADVRRLFVFPAATDDGNSIGAAWYAHHFLNGSSVARKPRNSVYLGRTYADGEIKAALDAARCEFVALDDEHYAALQAAERLSAGEIVGWYQGGAELGPRALGNRSILANPCFEEIKDRVNSTVKFRESFRPFAGAVLEEEVGRYFDLAATRSPHMLLVCPVKEEVRHLVPGVTHVDGTCRVQTVSAADNPLFHELISEFGRYTGVPIVLNTSFNVRGAPIVETPIDALHCFFSTQMNRLFLGRYAVAAPNFGECVPVLQWPDMTITRKSAQDAGARSDLVVTFASGRPPATVSETQCRLLHAIDGDSTVKTLAAKIGMDTTALVPMYLELYRKGFCYWRHMGPPPTRQKGRPHFNIDAS